MTENIQNENATTVLEKDDLGVESYTLNNDPEDKIERLCLAILKLLNVFHTKSFNILANQAKEIYCEEYFGGTPKPNTITCFALTSLDIHMFPGISQNVTLLWFEAHPPL
ncbi:18771_t:CDS:2 [Gigaspora rosea]|nr:18771_t:CDS:2 [Gigaspora rosea]